MTCEYAVTYESTIKAPVTIRGQVSGTTPSGMASKAIRSSKSRAKGVRWSSLVILLTKQGSQEQDSV